MSQQQAKQSDRQYSHSSPDSKHTDNSSWQTPYSIADEDLMFDGKPLNLLYEENRWQAEHRYGKDAGHVSFIPFLFIGS